MINLAKIKSNIPNFITVLNLFAGCIAVVQAFNGNLTTASWLIGIAAIFDFLDGMAARLFKAYSDIGKQLDSLADIVSFGVAPAAIIFQLLVNSLGYEDYSDIFKKSESTIPFIAFLIAVFSALRLAKFNIDQRQADHFIGLPTPANAIFFASFPFLSGPLCSDPVCMLQNTWFITGLVVFHSYLLVSEISLFSLKFKSLDIRNNSTRYVFLISALILLIILHYKSIPIIIYLYLLLSTFDVMKPKNKIK